MGIRDDFKNAAVEIFDGFGDVVIDGTLISRVSTYVAGGTTSNADTEYSVRLIRSDKMQNEFEGTSVNTTDVANIDGQFLTPASELPVSAKVKDLLRFDGNLYSIIDIANDAADALLIFSVVKQ